MMTMTNGQKNTTIKENAIAATILPENAIQIEDYSFAIPTEVDGEVRYAVVSFTAKNNKNTQISEAFDPEKAREKWLEEKKVKEQKAAEKIVEKERKAAMREAKKNKNTEE